MKEKINIYICPMHKDIQSDKPGRCPKCGMGLVPTEQKSEHENMDHGQRSIKKPDDMSLWEKFKMSMTMTMGMDHNGLAGREMAKMMEEDIKGKFFFALILSIPIILYSPL